MLIAGKQLSELSEDELRAWVEQLREKREALRNEAIKQKDSAAKEGKAKEIKDGSGNVVAIVSKDGEVRRKRAGAVKEVDDFARQQMEELMKDED